MKQYKLIIALLGVSFLFSCKKEETPTPVNNPSTVTTFDGNVVYTILDNQTHLPIENVYLNVAYGNCCSDDGYTDVNGKVHLSIPSGYVINEITITKNGYCTYHAYPCTALTSLNQTIYMDKFAYLRYHVINIAPVLVNDRIVIYSPHPYISSGYQFDFSGDVDTTFITDSKASNLGISCNLFTGSSFISSFYVNVTAIANDTIDVYVDF